MLLECTPTENPSFYCLYKTESHKYNHEVWSASFLQHFSPRRMNRSIFQETLISFIMGLYHTLLWTLQTFGLEYKFLGSRFLSTFQNVASKWKVTKSSHLPQNILVKKMYMSKCHSSCLPFPNFACLILHLCFEDQTSQAVLLVSGHSPPCGNCLSSPASYTLRLKHLPFPNLHDKHPETSAAELY